MAESITWGLIACDCPSDTNEGILYTAGADEECNGVLRVVNHDTVTATYGFAHCAATGVASLQEWIAPPGVQLDPARPPHEYSVHLGKSQELRRESGTANKVSFHFSGEKKVTS